MQKVFDVRENVKVGVRPLIPDELVSGQPLSALAAYNAGRRRSRAIAVFHPTPKRGAHVAHILSLLQNGVPGSASAIAAPALYRDEGRDGRVVYSNLPIERLSWTTRLLDAQVSRQQLLDGPDPLHSARSNRRQ